MLCQFSEDPPEVLRDRYEREEAAKIRPKYSLPVKILNWNEDLYLEEEKAKVASYKRDHCQLLIQKTRKMFKNLLRSVELMQESSYVTYGRNYQIQMCDLPTKINPESGHRASYGLTLSGVMNEKDIDLATHFIHGCRLTLSPDKAPCVRNVFIFVGCDGQSDGQYLYYGDDVYIRIYETGTDGYLFVQCENETVDDFGEGLSFQLTQSPDMYCRFKILHWNPCHRLETTGAPFLPHERVIIQHSASGKNVSGEYRRWIPTFFGAECIVSCNTYKDMHKMETAENFWKIVSKKEPDTNLYVRAAKGEEIPLDLLT